jgi:hypothetical protein
MKAYVTTGLTVLVGVALFEAALIPAVVVGGAAVLAPKYLPVLRRRLRHARNAKIQQRSGQARTVPGRANAEAPLASMGIGRAIAKTITFRIIVTTLDFHNEQCRDRRTHDSGGAVHVQPDRWTTALLGA